MGGYYDAGDNVKYGLPMAFTVTTLAWSAIFYESELKAAGELDNVRDAIKWGTDYFLKAYPKKNLLYVQVRLPVNCFQKQLFLKTVLRFCFIKFSRWETRFKIICVGLDPKTCKHQEQC